MESIKTAGSVLGTGFNAFISDWDKIAAAAAGVSLLALGVYTAKGGTGVLARYIESKIGKPSLVRETSRVNVVDTVLHPVKTLRKITVFFFIKRRRCTQWCSIGAQTRGTIERHCHRY